MMGLRVCSITVTTYNSTNIRFIATIDKRMLEYTRKVFKMGKFLLISLSIVLIAAAPINLLATPLLLPTLPCGDITGTLIDNMNAVGSWYRLEGYGGDATDLTAVTVDGRTGLQLSYNLGAKPTNFVPGVSPGPWAQIRRDFDPPLNMSAGDHLRFLHRRSEAENGLLTGRNTIEIGLIATDNKIYFGTSWNESTAVDWWTYATWDFKDFKNNGQPFPNFAQVKSIFISVVGSTKEASFGTGTFIIEDLQYINLAGRSIPANFTNVSISAAVRDNAAAWIAARQQPSGLLKSWQEEPAHFAYTYDQGLGLIVLANTDLAKARLLVEAMNALQDTDGSWYDNYDYVAQTSTGGFKKDIGPVAWWVFGLMRYYALETDKSRLEAAYQNAREGAAWIASHQRSDGSIRIVRNGVLQEPITEWNISAWWALQATGYQIQADRLRDYLVNQVWDSGMGRFKSSTSQYQIFLDAQTWGAAFLRAINNPVDARRALSYARAALVTTSRDESECGYDGAGPFSMWNEGTLQYINQSGENSLLHLQDVIDQLAPDGGLPNSPDNFTGYIIWLSQWHGVAPTAWLYFVATGEPFKITPPVLHAQPYRNYFTTSTPTLTWGRIAWAQEYEIQVDSSPSFTIPLSFTTTVPAVDASTQTTHLVDGVYYWRIRTKAGTRIGGWSVADSFVIDTP